MHTKKMDDGDYRFLLKLEDKYQFLVNDKNEEKTDGLLVIKVVPKDQDLEILYYQNPAIRYMSGLLG